MDVHYDPLYNTEDARSFVVVAGELEASAGALRKCVGHNSEALIGSAKDVVSNTRTLDGVLERLSATPGAEPALFRETQAQVKVAVHKLLKMVKDVQAAKLPAFPKAQGAAFDTELMAMGATLGRAKALLVAKTGRAPASPAVAKATVEKGSGTLRWEYLQKQAKEKEQQQQHADVPRSVQPLKGASPGPTRAATVSPMPSIKKASASPSTPPASTPSLDALVSPRVVVVQTAAPSLSNPAVAQQPSSPAGLPRRVTSPVAAKAQAADAQPPAPKKSASASFGVLMPVDAGERASPALASRHPPPPQQPPQLLPASAPVAVHDGKSPRQHRDRNEKLLEQLRAKCRWLEAELYHSKETRLTLHIVQAEGLASADPNGLSDPYCVVQGLVTDGGTKVETKVIQKTLDPVWDEWFTFEVPNMQWSFRIDIFDWSPDKAPQRLGYAEMRHEKWEGLGSKETRQWMAVLDGCGTLYCGLRLANYAGQNRVTGDQYLCACCQQSDIPDVFSCEMCHKRTCALCVNEGLCDTCNQDVCRRAKTKVLAEATETLEHLSPVARQVAEAQRLAVMCTIDEWKMERYQWPVWDASYGDHSDETPCSVVVPKSYSVEFGTPKHSIADLTMLDPFETYPHYTNHLIKADHSILIGQTKEGGVPVVLVVEKLSPQHSESTAVLQALLFSPDGTERQKLVIEPHELVSGAAGASRKAKQSAKAAAAASQGHNSDLRTQLEERFPGLQLQRVPAMSHADVAIKLLEYERNHTDQKRRIGVLFVPAGVREENAVFKSTGSPALYEFMDMLAERVRLEGWSKYAGGLNTKNNSTGLESYYTEFLGFSIMFHVNSLLEDDGSEQQLSRKRFIGNDLVVFVFLEGNEPFDPAMITSQMCHTFIVVKKVASSPTRYRISVVAKPSVPAFSPYLSSPNVFTKGDPLRQLLLAKALNANRATFQAKTFTQKTKRTRKDLLARLLKDLTDDKVLAASPPIVFDEEPSALQLCADNIALTAKSDFLAEDASFLSFRKGDSITAVSANPADVYWTGILAGRIGRFPQERVELGLSKKAGLFRSARDMHKSAGDSGAPPAAAGSSGSVSSRDLLALANAKPPGPPATFRIRLIKGVNMSVCDPWGTSDPYALVASIKDVNGLPIRTKVIKRTLNPEWNTSFDFSISPPFLFRIELYDEDIVGADDPMGYVDINSNTWALDKPGLEQIKVFDVIDGEGQLHVGLKLVGK